MSDDAVPDTACRVPLVPFGLQLDRSLLARYALLMQKTPRFPLTIGYTVDHYATECITQLRIAR